MLDRVECILMSNEGRSQPGCPVRENPLLRPMSPHSAGTNNWLLESRDALLWTPLIHAAAAGRAATCRHLVERHSCRLGATTVHSETALILAAVFGHTEATRELGRVEKL